MAAKPSAATRCRRPVGRRHPQDRRPTRYRASTFASSIQATWNLLRPLGRSCADRSPRAGLRDRRQRMFRQCATRPGKQPLLDRRATGRTNRQRPRGGHRPTRRGGRASSRLLGGAICAAVGLTDHAVIARPTVRVLRNAVRAGRCCPCVRPGIHVWVAGRRSRRIGRRGGHRSVRPMPP